MKIVSKGFYTAVVLKVSVFETTIENEKHFGTREEAEQFKKDTDNGELVTVIIQID